MGIEPTTFGLGRRRSTTELRLRVLLETEGDLLFERKLFQGFLSNLLFVLLEIAIEDQRFRLLEQVHSARNSDAVDLHCISITTPGATISRSHLGPFSLRVDPDERPTTTVVSDMCSPCFENGGRFWRWVIEGATHAVLYTERLEQVAGLEPAAFTLAT